MNAPHGHGGCEGPGAFGAERSPSGWRGWASAISRPGQGCTTLGGITSSGSERCEGFGHQVVKFWRLAFDIIHWLPALALPGTQPCGCDGEQRQREVGPRAVAHVIDEAEQEPRSGKQQQPSGVRISEDVEHRFRTKLNTDSGKLNSDSGMLNTDSGEVERPFRSS